MVRRVVLGHLSVVAESKVNTSHVNKQHGTDRIMPRANFAGFSIGEIGQVLGDLYSLAAPGSCIGRNRLVWPSRKFTSVGELQSSRAQVAQTDNHSGHYD